MKKTLFSIFIFLLVMLVFTGCTANLTEPEINFEPPVYVEQMPAQETREDFASTGSIFGQGDNPLFSDHKAMHVNDIVTVVISETAQSSNTGARALSKSDESSLGGGLFSSAGAGNSTVNNAISAVNGYTDIGYNTTSTGTFSGKASATKDASFTTTVSARVIKVLQNGNYYIAGSREILIDDQKQLVQISGVIRPYDIDQYNKINSAQMSDAKILYRTEGDVDRATKQGWGTKLIQAVWPF